MRISRPVTVGHTNCRSVLPFKAGGRLLGSVLWMVVAHEGNHAWAGAPPVSPASASVPVPPAPPPTSTGSGVALSPHATRSSTAPSDFKDRFALILPSTSGG